MWRLSPCLSFKNSGRCAGAEGFSFSAGAASHEAYAYCMPSGRKLFFHFKQQGRCCTFSATEDLSSTVDNCYRRACLRTPRRRARPQNKRSACPGVGKGKDKAPLAPMKNGLTAVLEKRGLWPHTRDMVVIPAIWRRSGRGFDSRHLHPSVPGKVVGLSSVWVGVYRFRQGGQRCAGNPRGDGRNPRKTTNANDERFAMAA